MGTQSLDGRRPGNPAAAAAPRRAHVSSDAVVAAPPPTRTESSAQAAGRTVASSPALPSPTPTASLPKGPRGRGGEKKKKKSCRLELCPLPAVSGMAARTIQQLNRTGRARGVGWGWVERTAGGRGLLWAGLAFGGGATGRASLVGRKTRRGLRGGGQETGSSLLCACALSRLTLPTTSTTAAAAAASSAASFSP